MQNYVFTDSFFKHIKAPAYKLELTTPNVISRAVIPPLEKIKFQFVGEPGVWRSAVEIGAVIDSRNVTDIPYPGNNASASLWLKIPASLPNVLAVKGMIIPERLSNTVTSWDVMGMNGNMHEIEDFEDLGNGYVQVIHSSRYSHGNEGESHANDVRFGVVFSTPELPAGVSEVDNFKYTVDYQHVLLMPNNGDIIDSLKTLNWQASWDYSILHKPAGTYAVVKDCQYILLRCL